MGASERLIHGLVEEFSECRPLLTEHLTDNEGELLPYRVMSDVARWAIQEVTHEASRAAELLRWLAARFVAADEVVETLIAVGFVEMLPATPSGDPLLELLGPELRQVAHEMSLFEPWGDQPN
jgi:hypothetical protein